VKFSSPGAEAIYMRLVTVIHKEPSCCLSTLSATAAVLIHNLCYSKVYFKIPSRGQGIQTSIT